MNKTELLVDRLVAARGWTDGLLKDIDESDWFNMPGPGIGHVAWQVGHIASSQVALIHVRCCDKAHDEQVPSGFRETFGKGSVPVADPAAYPAIPEIRSVFDRIQAECVELISGMTEDDFATNTKGVAHPMFTTREGAVGTAITHEGFHAGQIAMIRRLAGKAPLR